MQAPSQAFSLYPMLWIRIKITEYPEKELHGASYLILASHSEHLTVFMAEKAEPA